MISYEDVRMNKIRPNLEHKHETNLDLKFLTVVISSRPDMKGS